MNCPKCKKPATSYLGFNAREPEWFCENELCEEEVHGPKERMVLWDSLTPDERSQLLDTANPTQSIVDLLDELGLAMRASSQPQQTRQTAPSVQAYVASKQPHADPGPTHACPVPRNSPAREASHPRRCKQPNQPGCHEDEE